MRYQGGKKRIAKDILKIILKDRKPGQYYVEPFCGGCNVIELVEGPRIAADANKELIAMYKALQRGWWPPQFISEEFYKQVQKDLKAPPELRAYVGFISFGAKYFGGYPRGNSEFFMSYWNSVTRQTKKLNGVEFFNCSYDQLGIPKESIIYCDPPYAETIGYKNTGKFLKEQFWNWLRFKRGQGHSVFVSEYRAPRDFKEIWSKRQITNVDIKSLKEVTEKLFTLL